MEEFMKRRIIIIVMFVFGVLIAWGTFAAIRAHGNLVTLNVRNADVRDVIRKIEWQTWESIFVQKEVTGKITLNIHKVPLDEALSLIQEQASCRWTALYPLYSSGKSLAAFKKSMRGEINPVENGWTNYSSRPFFGGFGGGGFGALGGNPRTQDAPISLRFSNAELDIASLALARYAQGRLVPEDGVSGNIHLNLYQSTMPQAVAQIARQVHRKWTKYYVLQTGRGAPRGPRGTLADAGGPTPEMAANAQQRYEALLETMTPEERQKAEEARQRREKFQQMTPEQRRQAMAQRMADPQFQERMQSRMLRNLLDTTPEQRVERAQSRAQRGR
ncbi:MAG: hypothetical protein JWR26_4206 [Pedosphaera sp.]|nr:hypothetical protein [Pedosphaera sp.]